MPKLCTNVGWHGFFDSQCRIKIFEKSWKFQDFISRSRPRLLSQDYNFDICPWDTSRPRLVFEDSITAFYGALATCEIVMCWWYQGTVLVELMDHTDVIRDLNFAPDASLRLVSASRDGTLRVWQLQNGRVNGTVSNQRATVRLLVSGQSKWMYGCCWSPDANLLASVGDSQSVRFYLFLCTCTLLWFFFISQRTSSMNAMIKAWTAETLCDQGLKMV